MAELNERGQDVLRAVVQEFIASGEPVGSQQLTRRRDFEVSPATMRHVLAELEELGYLQKPHTSAGRVPTDQGFRYFVDSLLDLGEPDLRDRELIGQRLNQSTSVDERLAEAGKMLHTLSRHAGVVLVPQTATTVIQRIEFVRLRENRLLAILVSGAGQVQNKLIDTDAAISTDELVRASNYLNELLREGLSLHAMRERLRHEMETARVQYDATAARALQLGAAATELTSSQRLVIEGTGSFLEQREFIEDVQRMRVLFRALDEKHKLMQLLDRVQQAREMQIFIGAESEFSAQGEVALIASPFGDGRSVLGTVGVIGPTRIDYQRVIPLVHLTAQTLSSALTGE